MYAVNIKGVGVMYVCVCPRTHTQRNCSNETVGCDVRGSRGGRPVRGSRGLSGWTISTGRSSWDLLDGYLLVGEGDKNDWGVWVRSREGGMKLALDS